MLGGQETQPAGLLPRQRPSPSPKQLHRWVSLASVVLHPSVTALYCLPAGETSPWTWHPHCCPRWVLHVPVQGPMQRADSPEDEERQQPPRLELVLFHSLHWGSFRILLFIPAGLK